MIPIFFLSVVSDKLGHKEILGSYYFYESLPDVPNFFQIAWKQDSNNRAILYKRQFLVKWRRIFQTFISLPQSHYINFCFIFPAFPNSSPSLAVPTQRERPDRDRSNRNRKDPCISDAHFHSHRSNFFYEFDWLIWLRSWELSQAETIITNVFNLALLAQFFHRNCPKFKKT